MKITLSEYQKQALKVLNRDIAKSKKEQRRYSCMGMLEETGEIAAEIRKAFYKGNFHEKNIDKKAITSECGDLLWYMALICKESDINIEKIDVRLHTQSGEEEREQLITKAIRLGRRSGKTVQRYLEYHRGEVSKGELERCLRKQYRCMQKFLSELNITIDDVIEDNLQKVSDRYDGDER